MKHLLTTVVLGASILFATAALSFAQISAQPTGGSSGTSGSGTGTTPCSNTGIEYVPPRVVASGGTQCQSSTFQITIGVDGLGGQITITFTGCPSFLQIVPGHNKKTNKPGYNAVNPQPVNHLRQTYTADCGVFGVGAKCTPGDVTELNTTVTTWEEEGCGSVIPQTKVAPTLAPSNATN